MFHLAPVPVSRRTGPFYQVLRHRAEDLTGGGKKNGKAAPGRREPRRLRLRGGTSPGPFWAGRRLGYGLFGTFALASGRVPASQDELQSKPQALRFPIGRFVFILCLSLKCLCFRFCGGGGSRQPSPQDPVLPVNTVCRGGANKVSPISFASLHTGFCTREAEHRHRLQLTSGTHSKSADVGHRADSGCLSALFGPRPQRAALKAAAGTWPFVRPGVRLVV